MTQRHSMHRRLDGASAVPSGMVGRIVALVLFGVALALLLAFSIFFFFVLFAGIAVGLMVFLWRTRGNPRPGDDVIEVEADEVSEISPGDYHSRR